MWVMDLELVGQLSLFCVVYGVGVESTLGSS